MTKNNDAPWLDAEVRKYTKLPYSFVIRPVKDESGEYFYAQVLELDGCQSSGETFEEAFRGVQEAMYGWIATKIAHGFPVPEPIRANDYSGKFVVRLPRSLHAKLAAAAEMEGVSLNQYALHKLSV